MASKPTKRTFWALLGLAILGSGWIYWDYRQDMGVAQALLASGSQVAQTRCGPIEYAAEGEGPPVLIVHGASGGFDQGLDIGEPLVKAGFRIIAMSRFGYLRTPMPQDGSPEAQADAHACLLDALGLPRVAVLGASAGAPSALQFALRHPDRCRALVLLVPVLYVPRPDGLNSVKMPQGVQFMFETMLRSDFFVWLAPHLSRALVERALLGTPPEDVARADPEEQARIRLMIDQTLPVEPRRLGLLNDVKIVTSLRPNDLEKVSVPTLTVAAADDLFGTYDSAQYTAAHVPGARFIGYPTGGHMLVGHLEDVTQALAAFLKPEGR